MHTSKGLLVAAAVVASTVVASSAFAQGDPAQPQPAPGQPATQPAPGPTLTINSDGQTQGPTATTPTATPANDAPPKPEEKKDEEKPLIWRGSTLMADQSVSSETIGIGSDPQTRNPSYQLWFSLRPRFWLYQDQQQSVNIGLRQDLFKEITNADDTTQQRQDMLGDLWIDPRYNRRLYKAGKWSANLTVGPRFQVPISMASRAADIIFTAGGGGGVIQSIPLNASGDWFKGGRVGVISVYTHPFAKNTTAAPEEFSRERTSVDGRTLRDSQLSGGFLVEHQLLSVLDTGFSITPKLSFTADMIFIHQWRYTPKDDPSTACPNGGVAVVVQNGTACAGSGVQNQDPQRMRVSTWFLTSLDYHLADEIELSVGYYTFANTIGPDGTQQSSFYRPESSRVFFTATLSLDAIYNRARGVDAGGAKGGGNRVAGNTRKMAPPGLGFSF